MSKPIGDLNELNQRMIDNENRELTKAINEINADFNAAIVVRRMPEIVFKDYYLDNFKKIAASGDPDNAVTLSWIEVAGGPYAEVDIINNNGDVLFRVPSIVARPSVDHNRLKGVSFSRISAKYQAESNRLQVQGDRYLHGALSGVDQAVSQNQHDQNAAARWKEIFKRYEDPTSVNTENNKKEDKLENNLEFDYDD